MQPFMSRLNYTFQIADDIGAGQTANVQSGLRLCFSDATKSGFLTLRPICQCDRHLSV